MLSPGVSDVTWLPRFPSWRFFDESDAQELIRLSRDSIFFMWLPQQY